LRKDGLTLTFQLIRNIYQNGEWPRDFTEVRMITLKKKPKAANCSTTNVIAHTAKIVMTTIRRRIEEKTEDLLGDYQFGFGPRKGTRDALEC
jgi:hypothetical protein